MKPGPKPGSRRTLPQSHTFVCVQCGTIKTFAPRKAKQLAITLCSAACSARAQQPKAVIAAKSPEARERNRLAKRARGSRGYVKLHGRHEHRVVAEAMLGRALLPGEVVHHRNGLKSDNRPENLEVTNQSEHCKAHDFGHHPGARRGFK